MRIVVDELPETPEDCIFCGGTYTCRSSAKGFYLCKLDGIAKCKNEKSIVVCGLDLKGECPVLVEHKLV